MRHATLVILIISSFLIVPVASGATRIRDAAEKQMQYAQGLLSFGLYYEAAREFERFAKKYPQHEYAGAAAYYRAQSLYEYSSSPRVRKAARVAVAVFHRDYPEHAWSNLGYFLLGEIAMEEAMDLERRLGAAKRNNESTAGLESLFEAACKRAIPAYRKFVELTDLAKFKGNQRALEEMLWRRVTAHYNIAQCLVALKGQTYYEWGKRSGPTQKAVRLDLARKAYQGVMYFGTAGRTEFSDDARLGEAWCLFELRKYSDCRKLLKDNMSPREGRPSFFLECYNLFKSNPHKIDERWVRPLWPDIYYLYARCFFQEGEYEEARGYFERVMNMGGDNPWRPEATRMFDECGKRLAEPVKLATEADAIKAYQVAVTKYLTDRREDAITDFEQIWLGYDKMRTFKYRDQLLYYWGKSLLWVSDDGRLLEAAAVLNYLAKTGHPNTRVKDDADRQVSVVGEANYLEGLSYWRLGEELERGAEKDAIIEASMRAFERLAARNPEHPEAPETLLNVGHFHLGQKEYLKAGYAYRQMVTAYPTHENAGTALLNLCYVYRELGQLNDVVWAASTFEASFPRRPDVVQAIELKGAAWFRMAKEAEKPEEKKALFAKAAAEYGKLRLERYEWLSSIQREEHANTFANALFYGGYAYEQIGDKANALAAYRAFVESAPPDNTHVAEGRHYCGTLYLEEERYADAVEVLRPLAESLTEPDDTSYRGMATLVAALLKLAGAEADAAKKKELTDEAAARAEQFYTVYAATPIHHEPYLTIADAFEAAEHFDQMLTAYTQLRTNQILRTKEKGLTRAGRRKRFSDYAQLLFKAGEACGRAAEALEKQGLETKRFDSAGGELLDEHSDLAKKLAGRGRIPANYVEVNFLIAGMFKRAGEPKKGARALEKIIAVLQETDPRFLEAYLERGNVWLECGYPKRALASYIYIIDWADPDNPARAEYIARSYYQGGVAQFRVEETQEARARAKAMFEALIEKFGESEDKEIRAIVAEGREQIKKIEKLMAGAEGGSGT